MSLYLDHFGLREAPFRITPHTDFFFTGGNRGPTLDALIYAITQDEGIVKVTGEVGSGKTMLCRMLLEKLPERVETLYLANPSLSRDEILGAIADDLGVTVSGKNTHSMIRALQDALVARYAAGKRVVLLIDEAHAMPAESLEEIRLLSNLESKCNKLLQIALFAQPELDARLAANDMRQLRERITQHFSLEPLKQTDVAAYLEFRLRAAGYHGPNPFSGNAVNLIARASAGLSRRINILADKALLAAYSGGRYQVDDDEAKTAIRDARFSALPHSPEPFPWRHALIALGIALGIGGSFAIYHFWPQPIAVAAPPPPAPAPSPAPQAEVAKPTSAAPAATVAPLQQAAAAPVARPAPPPPTKEEPATALPPLRFGPLTRQHLESFDPWLAQVPNQHYFLQLLATDATSTGEIEAFLNKAGRLLDAQQLHVYRSNLSGKDRVGVIYGQYETREAAIAALRSLPDGIRNSQPFPRQVSKLK